MLTVVSSSLYLFSAYQFYKVSHLFFTFYILQYLLLALCVTSTIHHYNNTETNKLLQMIGNIYNKLPNNYLFTFKPHPASKFKYNFNFPLKCTNDKLNNLLHTHDIIVTTNSTSAVVDAYIMNKRVLQLINYGTLNFSPFYNIDNNIFFSNSDQLFLKLLNHKSSFNEFHFFNLDNQIPKWKNLLNKYL